ncbi:kynurenine/alpha-aminoadipate aminotransferase, mitochondrial-like isoform X2 [Patella vulgata]|uniref:kynurenine/alpha-aminoadipate aminotransferase, mitochondrial-like isoform X2 n=1 Tax=Patella vulgata TaxID=6465 RepID=UPI00217F386F|nr:kynurenine/alpha-aminoadipate aminotransferase, mitochondrial-like isoform X2 [Patella vulgata]
MAQGVHNGIGDVKFPEYQQFVSRIGARSKNSAIRDTFDEGCGQKNVNMVAGLPNPKLFPILSTEITLNMPEMIDWLIDLQRRVHNPPTLGREDHPGQMELMIIAGCQDGISTCFRILLNEGDTLLIQNPSYPTMFNMVESIGCTPVGIDSDEHGISASKMRTLLENWETSNPVNKNAPRPKVLYCIPTGENPRSASWSFERRQAVYQICREFNLLIMEDDPYYFTYFNRPLPRSMLSIDVDGRVLRFDSFSKVMCPGFRLGCMSGPRPVMMKMLAIYMSTTAQASAVSQMTLMAILKKWGYEGFMHQCDRVSQFLKQNASYFVDAATIYLSDVAEWTIPDSGMFLWLRFKDCMDATDIMKKCDQQGLSVLGGFNATAGKPASPYVRIAYALSTKEEIIEACKIMARVAKEERNACK